MRGLSILKRENIGNTITSFAPGRLESSKLAWYISIKINNKGWLRQLSAAQQLGIN